MAKWEIEERPQATVKEILNTDKFWTRKEIQVVLGLGKVISITVVNADELEAGTTGVVSGFGLGLLRRLDDPRNIASMGGWGEGQHARQKQLPLLLNSIYSQSVASPLAKSCKIA